MLKGFSFGIFNLITEQIYTNNIKNIKRPLMIWKCEWIFIILKNKKHHKYIIKYIYTYLFGWLKTPFGCNGGFYKNVGVHFNESANQIEN